MNYFLVMVLSGILASFETLCIAMETTKLTLRESDDNTVSVLVRVSVSPNNKYIPILLQNHSPSLTLT